jgi:hypothetical protein
LIQLLPFLGVDQWKLSFNEVVKTKDPDERAWALQKLMPFLLQMPKDELFVAFQSMLKAPSSRGRLDLLSDIAALIPLVAEIGGTRALTDTALAVQDVASWWP